VKALFLSIAPRLPKKHCFFKVLRLRPFVLQVRVACRWRWEWSTNRIILRMMLTAENRSTHRKTCPNAKFSTKNLNGAAPRSNPGLRDEMQGTSGLSHDSSWEWNFNMQFIPITEHCASITKTNRLLLFREIVVYCENHVKHTNAWCEKNAWFL
jgi:hypothetical protein